MKIVAINGSPRKKWNTATILENVLAGATEAQSGIETELVDLYTLKYTGCVSCFECKRIGGPSYGKCAVRDGLAPVLESSLHADILVIGSPIYFGDVTGMLRCYLERLCFPCFVYDKDYTSIAPRKLFPAFIYTMNAGASVMEAIHYPERLAVMQGFAGRLFGHEPEILYVTDTLQFKDYSRYAATLFDAKAKEERHEKVFPEDCEKARELGAKLAKAAAAKA